MAEAELSDGQRQALETEYRTHKAYLEAENMERNFIAAENTEIATKEGGVTRLNGNHSGVHRFQKGNPGGPGRKRASMEDRAIRLMNEETSDEDIRLVWRKVIEGALLGHTKKQELFITQTAGTATQRTQVITNTFQDILDAVLLGTSDDS